MTRITFLRVSSCKFSNSMQQEVLSPRRHRLAHFCTYIVAPLFLIVLLLVPSECTAAVTTLSLQHRRILDSPASSPLQHRSLLPGSDRLNQLMYSAVDTYAQHHAAMLQAVRSGTVRGKYLVYRDVGCEDIVGMGNRVAGFVSALILAYVTNRIFLADERLTDGILKCKKPCTRCHTITGMLSAQQRPIEWNYPTTADTSQHAELQSLADIQPWIEWSAESTFALRQDVVRQDGSPLTAATINLRQEHLESAATQWISCTNFNDQSTADSVGNIDALVMYSTQSYVHLLTSNPYHSQQIVSAFGLSAFHTFSNYFMQHPSERLQPRIDGTLERMAAGGCLAPIGIHVRRHGNREFLDDAGENAIFNCAQWTALEHSLLVKDDTDEVVTGGSCLFVSSDTASTRERAMSQLSPYGIEVYWLEGADIEIDAAHATTQDDAMIDWFILRYCADRVITAGSSFGLTAAFGSLRGSHQPLTTIQAEQPKWYRGPVCVRFPSLGPVANPLLPDGSGSKPMVLENGLPVGMQCNTDPQQNPAVIRQGVVGGQSSLFSVSSYVSGKWRSALHALGVRPRSQLSASASGLDEVRAISVHTLYLPPQWWNSSYFEWSTVLACLIPLLATAGLLGLLCRRYAVQLRFEPKAKHSPMPRSLTATHNGEARYSFLPRALSHHVHGVEHRPLSNGSNGQSKHGRSHSFNHGHNQHHLDETDEEILAASSHTYHPLTGVSEHTAASSETPSRRRSQRTSHFRSPASPGLSYRNAASPKRSMSQFPFNDRV